MSCPPGQARPAPDGTGLWWGAALALRSVRSWCHEPAYELDPQPTSGETFWSVSNGVSKPFFAALLALFAREAGAGRERILVLGLDNAGWHTAPNPGVPEGIRLVSLPRSSPELQPAEPLWPVLDEPLANQYF